VTTVNGAHRRTLSSRLQREPRRCRNVTASLVAGGLPWPRWPTASPGTRDHRTVRSFPGGTPAPLRGGKKVRSNQMFVHRDHASRRSPRRRVNRNACYTDLLRPTVIVLTSYLGPPAAAFGRAGTDRATLSCYDLLLARSQRRPFFVQHPRAQLFTKNSNIWSLAPAGNGHR